MKQCEWFLLEVEGLNPAFTFVIRAPRVPMKQEKNFRPNISTFLGSVNNTPHALRVNG